jgi:hypothetical protein
MPYKPTSSFIDARATRTRTRGAIFVEAIVVISALTLGVIALAYVRDLYVQQMTVARLTRAAVIAHSMAGCKTNQPREWLGRDLASYTVQGGDQEKQSARGKDSGAPSGMASGKASTLVQRSGATSSDGQGLLNPITDAEFGGQAKATGKESRRGSRTQTVFSGKVRAKSFVSCGDEVKDGDFDRVLGVMKDEISNLLGK